ncbi:uncharacterized protein LOC124180677 [Neodiprion fabricii]|uniref:uncharacterized protein LOC124180677 n=1 Tax=Neodiprion fabricii TaxID=2872261 RepID=UPI001ED961DC|nr:uncharacterized protein LOC124180677 [Neodiprion fabricii]
MGKEDPPIDKKRPAVVHTPPSDRRLRSQVSTQATQLFEGQLENLEETNASGNSSLTPEQSQISNENSNPTNKNSPENSRKTEKPTQILIQTPDSENQSQTHIKIPQEFKMVSEPVASTGATASPAPTYHYISIKDALEAVPVFDGNPSQVRSFVPGCKDAREMVPPQVELSLARIIRNKIKGVARRVIENERFDTVDELTARINELYGPAKSVNLCQADGKAAFLRGLRPEIDGKIPTVPGTLKELVDAAMKIEKQEKIKIKLRRGDQPSTIQDATINYAMFQPYNCVVCGANDHDKYDCQYNSDKSYYDHRKPRNQTYVIQGRTDRKLVTLATSDMKQIIIGPPQNSDNKSINTIVKPESIFSTIKLEASELQNPSTFMLDTGSDLNIIKNNCVRSEIEINEQKKFNLSGKVPACVETMGEVPINVIGTEAQFHIVPENLPIPQNGIIGSQFFNETRAQINFDKGTLEFGNVQIPFLNQQEKTTPYRAQTGNCDKLAETELGTEVLPLLDVESNGCLGYTKSDLKTEISEPLKGKEKVKNPEDVLVIPSRTRLGIRINLEKTELTEGYLPLIDADDNVYIGNALVANRDNKAYLYAINTSDSEVRLRIPPQILEEISETEDSLESDTQNFKIKSENAKETVNYKNIPTKYQIYPDECIKYDNESVKNDNKSTKYSNESMKNNDESATNPSESNESVKKDNKSTKHSNKSMKNNDESAINPSESNESIKNDNKSTKYSYKSMKNNDEYATNPSESNESVKNDNKSTKYSNKSMKNNDESTIIPSESNESAKYENKTTNNKCKNNSDESEKNNNEYSDEPIRNDNSIVNLSESNKPMKHEDRSEKNETKPSKPATSELNVIKLMEPYITDNAKRAVINKHIPVFKEEINQCDKIQATNKYKRRQEIKSTRIRKSKPYTKTAEDEYKRKITCAITRNISTQNTNQPNEINIAKIKGLFMVQNSHDDLVKARVELLESLLRLEHSNTEEKENVYNLIRANADIFHLPGDNLECTEYIKYTYQCIEVRENFKIRTLKVNGYVAVCIRCVYTMNATICIESRGSDSRQVHFLNSLQHSYAAHLLIFIKEERRSATKNL